jgi:hypothetical protein
VIQPQRFPYMGLPYSPAILAGDTLYLAGRLERDPATTKLVPGGIEAETLRVRLIARLSMKLRAHAKCEDTRSTVPRAIYG